MPGEVSTTDPSDRDTQQRLRMHMKTPVMTQMATMHPATMPAIAPTESGSLAGGATQEYGGTTGGASDIAASIRPFTFGVPRPVTASKPLQARSAVGRQASQAL